MRAPTLLAVQRLLLRAPTLLTVAPLLLHDPAAHWLFVAAAVAVVVGEVVATVLGRVRDRERRLLGGLADSLVLYVRGRGAAVRQDRGTRLIIILAVYLGIAAALVIARMPGLRAYANNWWTLGLGVAIVLAGVALRAWAILSLGRYFRREVTIEPDQRLVRRGPYRVCATRRTPASFSSSPVSGLPSGAGSVRPSRCSSSLPGCCRAFGWRNARLRRRSALTTPSTRTRRRACSPTSGSWAARRGSQPGTRWAPIPEAGETDWQHHRRCQLTSRKDLEEGRWNQQLGDLEYHTARTAHRHVANPYPAELKAAASLANSNTTLARQPRRYSSG
jgi:hypothetical protein